jgi:excisionase family DNA binding protein
VRGSGPSLRVPRANQVAEQTGTPLSVVYEVTRTGHLPAVRFGRRVRYNPAAVAAWLAAGGTSAAGAA